MRHEHENARRHAYNTLAEVNRHLDKGNITNPRHHEMLTNMMENATRTLRNLDDMENRRPYSDTNIGYNANVRGRERTRSDADDAVRNVMDAIDRILPHISDDDRYDVDDRRGVPGTGRRAVRRVRADRYDDDRYDMDDDRYDDMDDSRVVDMPRWRSARTGRFLPNLYGPSRVRRVRRRAEMDDINNRYDDDRYDDDTQRTTDETRRMADEARRAADDARRAAEEARRTTDDMRNMPPTMRTERGRYDDTRSDRTDRRYDARTDDDTHRPGPDTRR